MVCSLSAPRDRVLNTVRNGISHQGGAHCQMAYRVTSMSDVNAEADEDDGLAKPAGPVWAIVGGLIGLAVAFSLVWFVISHR